MKWYRYIPALYTKPQAFFSNNVDVGIAKNTGNRSIWQYDTEKIALGIVLCLHSTYKEIYLVQVSITLSTPNFYHAIAS